MGDLGIPAATARSSLARLCSRGVLRREPRDGVAGYALEPAAVPMLERGDDRIFGERVEATAWCLLSFSFPERRRGSRDRLRRRLSALGCGTVADGLWIAPAALEDELAATAHDIAGEADVVLFADAAPRGDLAAGLARWYDLEAIRRVHESFLARFGGEAAPADDAQAFALWIRALDEWRVIPYRDPGLPSAELPVGWPGADSAVLFRRLRERLEDRAVAHVAAVAGPARTVAAAR
ncbi:PaaX family transcriptional regulator C-terminal domain-containing protein [Leifsonia poae]|uniref:PaaX family transcriptional regulator C-terminal domain-containing protein n=1 Tax=Leifsonia poae TaxID=110933 RepID=UPI003D6910A1